MSERLHRSVAACLAELVRGDAADVPVPPADHPEPWTVWRGWLAGRGLGLVPIAEPTRFDWPGPWLALLAAADGGGEVAAVAFGSPPGIAWHPLGGPEDFAAVRSGHVVAPHDAALWSPPERSAERREGVVEAIVVGPSAEGALTSVAAVRAHAGLGLEGDRYFHERGTFTNPHARGIQLTLVEAEVLDDLGLSHADTRRNVVTRGVDLDALVGREFAVGAVRCAGARLCEPCAHLERLTPGTLRPLVHRGGLRADILAGGELRVGDPVVAV